MRLQPRSLKLCGAWKGGQLQPIASPVCLKVAKAEQPESSVVPVSGIGATTPLQREPSTSSPSVAGLSPLGPKIPQTRDSDNLLQADMESPWRKTLVDPPQPSPKGKETKAQSSKDANLPPASKSWNWATLEAPVPPGQPEVSRGKGECWLTLHITSWSHVTLQGDLELQVHSENLLCTRSELCLVPALMVLTQFTGGDKQHT